jgi:hypothetical protein
VVDFSPKRDFDSYINAIGISGHLGETIAVDTQTLNRTKSNRLLSIIRYSDYSVTQHNVR